MKTIPNGPSKKTIRPTMETTPNGLSKKTIRPTMKTSPNGAIEEDDSIITDENDTCTLGFANE